METIGKYQIQKVLGRGGMGTVYEALDPTLHRKVAVKVMLQGLADNPDFHARFLREAQAAGGLRHRNIVTVYDLGEDKGQPFIAMELLEGTDLEAILRSHEPRSLEWKIDVVRQMCEGLAFAHRAGIVHRDVKPANIRVTTDNEVKIMDFGIAHLKSSTMTRTGNVLGTVQYMSPEQIAGEKVDHRGDVFSVGVIAYELAAERRPFDGDNPATVAFKIVHETADPGPVSGTQYSPRLEQIVLKALAREPGLRYQSLEEMLTDLAALSSTAARAPAIGVDEFFVEDSPSPSPNAAVAFDEFVVDDTPAQPAALPVSAPIPAADAEVFFVDELAGEPAAPPVSQPPALAPASEADDGFFVMEEPESAGVPAAASPQPAPVAKPAAPPAASAPQGPPASAPAAASPRPAAAPATPRPAPPRVAPAPPVPVVPPASKPTTPVVSAPPASAPPAPKPAAPPGAAPMVAVPPAAIPPVKAAPAAPAPAASKPLGPAPATPAAPAPAKPAASRGPGPPSPAAPPNTIGGSGTAPQAVSAPSVPPQVAAPTPRARPASPSAATPPPRTPSRRPAATPSRAAARAPWASPRALGIAAGALVLVGIGGYVASQLLAKPELQSVAPMRARIGEPVTLVGRNFSATAANDVVTFGNTRAVVQSATATTIVAEVPELPATAGRDTPYPVTVRVRGRDSQAISVAVFQAGRIHGLSPDVAMPGEEVTLAGSGWAPNAIVRFGSTPAEIVEATPTQIRVRVPEIEGPPGTSAPVTVADGMDVSNAAPFLLGRLPLIMAVQPASAASGDVVTLSGRGFHWKAAENVLRVDGVRAFVVSAVGGELKFVVPWVSHSGAIPLALEVPESQNKGSATLEVSAASDPVDFRFAVEPVETTPPCNCAAVSTPLGPAFVLAAAGNRSAADRALEAARRLNEAAIPIKASRDATFEVRNVETRPILAVSGRPDTVLEVADEDAAAYNEDWTRLGGKGGPVTAGRLAVWWQAVARDLVLVLVRGEKPQHAGGLAPEGRVLGEVYETARKTGRFGVGRDVVAAMKPPTLAALKVVGLRVPAQVVAPAGAAPAAVTAATPAPTTSTAPPLQLDGVWVGYSLEGGARRYITLTFQGRSGQLSFEGGVSISLPLFGVEQPQKDAVRFGVEYRGGTHYYSGRWDGKKITGRISTDKSGRGETGAFELSRR